MGAATERSSAKSQADVAGAGKDTSDYHSSISIRKAKQMFTPSACHLALLLLLTEGTRSAQHLSDTFDTSRLSSSVVRFRVLHRVDASEIVAISGACFVCEIIPPGAAVNMFPLSYIKTVNTLIRESTVLQR